MVGYRVLVILPLLVFFFFNDTATTEIYTLSLHDALPISLAYCGLADALALRTEYDNASPSVMLPKAKEAALRADRKSTRLNSSHLVISYAVFCLKKKIIDARFEKQKKRTQRRRDNQKATA